MLSEVGEVVLAKLKVTNAVARAFWVMEDGEFEDDLVWGVTEVMTSLCARLYGSRSARRRTEWALAAAREA